MKLKHLLLLLILVPMAASGLWSCGKGSDADRAEKIFDQYRTGVKASDDDNLFMARYIIKSNDYLIKNLPRCKHRKDLKKLYIDYEYKYPYLTEIRLYVDEDRLDDRLHEEYKAKERQAAAERDKLNKKLID